MAATRKPCTIWWVDEHWGGKPPTLGHTEAEQTEKMVYHRSYSGSGVKYRLQSPVAEVFFTPEDALKAALGRAQTKLRDARAQVENAEMRLGWMTTLWEETFNADR